MFGHAGLLYVYFTYGMHWCANVVCGEAGHGTAVLLRGAAPIEGVDEMFEGRPAARRDRDLCSGPAKLCQAFGLDGSFDGADLVVAAVVSPSSTTAHLHRPTRFSPESGHLGRDDQLWRWYVADDPNVSRR